LELGALVMARIVLAPGRAERHYWRDLWAYRELFTILAWRDVAVRYKQTVVGVGWSIVRPFLTMVIFTIVFCRLARLASETAVPYGGVLLARSLDLPRTLDGNHAAELGDATI
jgi:lipopolysaccharide transport system permease protein